MPPKGAIRGTGVGRPAQQKGGYARQIIDEVTSQENRSVVTAVTFFAGLNDIHYGAAHVHYTGGVQTCMI
ncbi:hypothetical protein D0860_02677 [Hortaea werneckii]|uniref:Uncharacterized protein n=1 Tax=Hortaea werneckii TaxID=91943 RepID=A0A3M7HJN7_HORWE|nr:hypothetical protein D0860_02677 [Hortaea werneckii]